MARPCAFELSPEQYDRAAAILALQRAERNETQLAAALRLGTGPGIISNIERRAGKRPSAVVHAILVSAGVLAPAA